MPNRAAQKRLLYLPHLNTAMQTHDVDTMLRTAAFVAQLAQRFKGRGQIQITGRFNYKKCGEPLGTDLVWQPELAAQPAVAFSTASLF